MTERQGDEAQVDTADEGPRSREERRRRTDAAILRAAKELFGETGFERTTIRAVAARAGIDPALVMQHYGSKDGLFAAAARWSDGHSRILSATSDNLPRAALDDLFEQFEDDEDREGKVALMRSCLTHPGATSVLRDEVMCQKAEAVSRTLDGEEAELRAGIFGACLMGLGLARYLIASEPLASASREDVTRLMEPVLRALVDGPDAAAGDPRRP